MMEIYKLNYVGELYKNVHISFNTRITEFSFSISFDLLLIKDYFLTFSTATSLEASVRFEIPRYTLGMTGSFP